MIKVCTKCSKKKEISFFYKSKTKKKDGTYYNGYRKECKPCTLNRNEQERSKWNDGKYHVYILPEENYCGYTNNVRRRMNQHSNNGKNTYNYLVVFSSECPIKAHLEETKLHLLGYKGFAKNIGQKTMKYPNRRANLQKELEVEQDSAVRPLKRKYKFDETSLLEKLKEK